MNLPFNDTVFIFVNISTDQSQIEFLCAKNLKEKVELLHKSTTFRNDFNCKTSSSVKEIQEFLENKTVVLYIEKLKASFINDIVSYFTNMGKTLDLKELIMLLEPFHKDYTLSSLYENWSKTKLADNSDNTTLLSALLDTLNIILERTDLEGFIKKYSGILYDWSWLPYIMKYSEQHQLMRTFETSISLISNTEENISPLSFPKEVEKLLKDEKLWSKNNERYKFRKEQYLLSSAIRKGFEYGNFTLCEAPTGTGKSMAYLLPSIPYALKGEKVFVSTNTKELQAQLVTKDIPSLLKCLGHENTIKCTLIKGKSNYLCPSNIRDFFNELSELPLKERLGYVYLRRYAMDFELGDIEELNYTARDMLNINEILSFCANDDDGCDISSCPYSCHYKSKVEALEDSNLIVLNHSLLLRWPYSTEIRNVVIDEAHNLNNCIYDAYGDRINSKELTILLSDIYNPELKRGYLSFLWKNLKVKRVKFEVFTDKIILCIGIIKRINNLLKKQGIEDYDSNHIYDSSYYLFNELNPIFNDLHMFLKELYSLLFGLMDSNNLMEKGATKDRRTESLRRKIEKLNDYNLILDKYLNVDDDSQCKSFISSKDKSYWEIVILFLNSSYMFKDRFLSKLNSCAFLSATLKTKGNFNEFRKITGLNLIEDRFVNEVKDISSVFDLGAATVISTYSDGIKYTSGDSFIEFMVQEVLKILGKIDGNALVLFTSNLRKEKFIQKIYPYLTEKNIFLYTRKKEISKLFHSENKSILVGSKGFFEGIDIPGNSLTCVILDKVPNISKSFPLYRKLMDNGVPYNNINEPRVITDLKQCFGRLIRSQYDYGYFIVIDPVSKANFRRIISAEYPNVPFIAGNSENILNSMNEKYLAWNIRNLNSIIFNNMEEIEKLIYTEIKQKNTERDIIKKIDVLLNELHEKVMLRKEIRLHVMENKLVCFYKGKKIAASSINMLVHLVKKISNATI